MSVTSVQELTDRSGDVTGEEGNDQRTFLVTVDSQADTISTIASSGLLPAYLSVHPNNVYFTCRSLSVKPAATHWRHWIATAKYSSAPLTQREKEKQEPNPLLRRAKIRWSSRDEAEAMFFDEDGNACINSAGDFYDPVPEKLIGNWTATIEKNVADVPIWFLDYASVVNSDAFELSRGTIVGTGTAATLVVPAGYAKLSAASISEELQENGIDYVTLSMTIELKKALPSLSGQVLDRLSLTPVTPEPWDLVVLDQGLREKIPAAGTGTGAAAAGEIRQILDDEGNMINSPIPLDGDGYKLDDPTPGTVFYFRHRKYPRKPFSVLPLT